MTFGEKLQELRRKAGMSQDTLAEQLDVSRQAVSKWERDETMPETEKVVRIAQLFHVSLDELLLNKVRQEEPDPQPQPQPAYAPRGNRYQKQLRRHGYKLGYIPMTLGAIICVFSLLVYFIWPAFGNSFFGSASDLMSDFGSMNSMDIVIEGDGELTPDMEQAILDAIGGSSYIANSPWGSTTNQMNSMMSSALKAQANLFLIGLLPGGVLLAVGIFIVVKGKKYTRQMPDGM